MSKNRNVDADQVEANFIRQIRRPKQADCLPCFGLGYKGRVHCGACGSTGLDLIPWVELFRNGRPR